MNRASLTSLSKDDLIALVLAQSDVMEKQATRLDTQDGQIKTLMARVAELEAKQGGPPKTPDNSSTPPSAARKPNRAERRREKRKGRPGVCRALAENPTAVVEALAKACPHCEQALSAEDQPGFHAYDHIELPPIEPVVTRIHRHCGTCPGCMRKFQAPAPEGMEPGSPFGPGIAALIIHLHVTQAISFERLAGLMKQVFGLVISEGAISNMLARAEAPMIVAAEKIAEIVRNAKVVASDETSARVKGKTWWQWVMTSATAVYHVITDSRGAQVVTDFLQGQRPEIWIADRLAAQNGHAAQRQVCLAHLLRDTQYAIDEGDTIFAPAFRALLHRAFAIGRKREHLKDATLAQYRARLEDQLVTLFKTPPKTKEGRKLVRGLKRCFNDLFIFITRRDVSPTNNGCERELRPSVIFRKVTGCFRSYWGARVYAAAASVIATGRLNGKSALQAIREVIAPRLYPAAA